MKHTDFLIVGTGAAGLFCALQIPSDKQVLMITKEDADESDSFLAQGGIWGIAQAAIVVAVSVS